MSITKLLEQHRALLEQADRATYFSAVTAAEISRPVELQEQRVAAIKQRIQSLEASKQEYAKQVDETVKALREDLAGLERRIAIDREALAPIVQAIEGGHRPTGSGGTRSGRPAAQGKQSGRRKGRSQKKDET